MCPGDYNRDEGSSQIGGAGGEASLLGFGVSPNCFFPLPEGIMNDNRDRDNQQHNGHDKD